MFPYLEAFFGSFVAYGNERNFPIYVKCGDAYNGCIFVKFCFEIDKNTIPCQNRIILVK